MFDLEDFKKLSVARFKENEQFLLRLKKKKPKDLDKTVLALHQQVFNEIDCLECANCCKTTSPAFFTKDIERLAKELRIKSSEFIDQYLQLDTDHAFMFKSEPCPFLLPDHYCAHYKSRPLACKEYPHTDRARFYQVLDITLKNTMICPAVLRIVEELKARYLS